MRRFIVLAWLVAFVGAPGVFTAYTAPPHVQIIALSNSRPNITVIDAETNRVIDTANVSDMTTWGWNDDNNYFDGEHLWVGMLNPNNNAAEVALLNLNTRQIDRRIPIGKETITVYIGKPSRTGNLLVAKQGSRQLVVIDIKTRTVQRTIDLPMGNGGVACDVDVGTALDGKERAYVPGLAGNRVVAIDIATLQVAQTLDFPEGTKPFMLTVARDGRRLWVQEQAGNSNVILNGMNLLMVARSPAGAAPITGTFSPDGKLHFTGHRGDPIVIANDTETFAEVWRTRVGARPEKLGVHPNGRFLYAALAGEDAVVVLEAATGHLVERISLGTTPVGLFVRTTM